MIDYREEQLKKAKFHFTNHKAEIKEHGEITTLDWRKKNGSSNYYVHYVFDGCFLYISGDLGSAVIHLSGEATLKSLASFSDVDYFAKKIECSTDKYMYIERIAREQLKERLFPDDEDEESNLLAPELIDELMEHYNMIDGFQAVPIDLIEQVEELDQDYLEWLHSCGEVIDTRVILWLMGLQMAWEQVKDYA